MSAREDPTAVVDNLDVLVEFESVPNPRMAPPVVPVNTPAFEERREKVSHASTCSAGVVLLPKNPAIRWWQVVVTFSVVVTCLFDTLLPAFDSTVWGFWAIVYACDVIFLADIILTFFVAFVNHNGIVVKDRKTIRKRYLTRTFALDLLSVLPTDMIAAVYPGASGWRTLTLVRLNRLIRLYRISTFCASREAELGTNTGLLRSVKYFIISVVSTHAVTCGWYALACNGKHVGVERHCRQETWAISVSDSGLSNSTSTLEAYLISLYWAVATATSTGYGDISAVNEAERWYSVLAMLVGIGVFFGMLLGGLTSMLTNLDQQRASFVHRMNTIKDHLEEYEVAQDLQTQAIGYYEYLWARKKGVLSEGIYKGLPLTFQAEICHTTNSGILEKAPIFEGLGEGFLRMLSLNIKPLLYLPKQIIITKGDVGHQMFFIHRGEVEVLSEEDDDTPIATLKSGKLFGEVSLLCSLPRTATIRASTHCDLMVLEKHELNAMLVHYPAISDRLHKQARSRMNNADSIMAGELSKNKVQEEATFKFKAFQARPSSYVEPSRFRNRRQSFIPEEIAMSQLDRSGSKTSSVFSLRSGPKRMSVALSRSLEVINTLEETTKRDSIAEKTINRCIRIRNSFNEITFDPKSKFRMVWDYIVLVVAVIIAFLYPYMACFTAPEDRSGYFDNEIGHSLLGISYILDAFLVFDIIVQLRTSVATPHGNLTNFSEIVSHYCKTAIFFCDVFSVLPLEIFSLVAPSMVASRRIFAFLRLNRVGKLMRLRWTLTRLESSLNVSLVKLRSFKFLLYIMLLSHWMACTLYASACSDKTCKSNSWIGVHSMAAGNQTVEPLSEYIMSLYWAVATMTSTGYGDISAKTMMGRFFALSAMLIGLLLYGYCLAQMAATLANLDAAKVGFQERLFAVKEFMKERGLGAHLQLSVMTYLQIMWDKYKGCWMPGQKALMFDMPLALQADIAMEDVTKTLARVPLFKNTEASFLRALALKTQRYLFSPGDIVIYAGDVGREMYCVRRGRCQVLTPDLKDTLAEIGPGQYFGAIGMLYGDYRTATVRAETHCEMLQLELTDMNAVLKDFPLLQSQFDMLYDNREKVTKLQEEARTRMCSSQSASMKDFVEVIKEANIEIQKKHQIKKMTPPPRPSMKSFSSTLPTGEPYTDYLEPFTEIGALGRLFAHLLMRRVFLPQGKFLKWWTILMVVIATIQAFTLPLQASLLYNDIGLWVLHYLMDIFMLANLYIGLHTGFYNDEQVLVTHPLATARNYARTNFIIDFVSAFPIEVFAFASSPHFEAADIHLFALVRLNRIIQLYRLPLAFAFLESDVQRETGSIRGVKFFFYTVLFLNWLTCGLFVLACPPIHADSESYFNTSTGHDCRTNSWLQVSSSSTHIDIAEASVGTLYTACLYWASATAVSVGYGEISANTDTEMMVALIFMVMGVLFFGNIIAGVAASMANADAQRARFQEKLNDIKNFMKDEKLDPSMQDRVISYYEYIWLRTRGVEPESLFNGLPLSLWGDVTYCLYQEIISKISLFKDTEVSFIKMLSKCVKPILFLKGEYIVRKHDIGSEMYFIHRGAVDVVAEDGVTIFDTMRAGSSFGEVALLFSCPRTASIRARFNSDLFQLTKSDLDLVLDYYPAIKQKIMMIGEERRMQARKRSAAKAQIQKSQMVLLEKLHQQKQEDEEAPEVESEPEDEEDALAAVPTPPPSPRRQSSSSLRSRSYIIPEVELTVENTCEEASDEMSCKSSEKDRTSPENTNTNNPGEKDEAPVAETPKDKDSWFRRVNRFTISPNSTFCTRYALFMAVVSYLNGWLILYQLAYQEHHPSIIALSYMCDFFFYIEMYVKFHLSFYNDTGDLIDDFDIVFNNYLRRASGFPLDFIANVPIDVFAFCPSDVDVRWKALSVLRLIHLLRLATLSQYFSKWEMELDINMLVVRLCKFFVILTLLIHCSSCVWYLVSCPLDDCTSKGWVLQSNPSKYSRSVSAYCTSIYWCVATMTSTGYGDIRAHNVIEMLFASLVMICGKLIFGFILGSIASTLANQEARRVQYEQQLQALKSHMLDQDVSRRLQYRVIDYYDYLWRRNKGVTIKSLFRDAPSCMFAEISLSLSHQLLKTVPLFQEADDSFNRYICQNVNQMLFMPGDFIVRKGDVGHEVFYIHRGEVEVVDEENSNTAPTAVLGEGSIFGEVSLVCHVPRRVTVRARTHVDLLTLSKVDLDRALLHYPALQEQIQVIAAERFGPVMREIRVTQH